MDISQAVSFLRIVERGSLTLAAADLGVTQSGLSRQVQRLEQELGADLLRRGRSGIRLTPAGERFRAFAEQVVALHRGLLADLGGAGDGLSGELRVAASTTPSEFLVPRLVAGFTARYPDVRAVVETTDSEGVIGLVVDRRCDVGFVGARFERPHLSFDPVAEDEVLLAVPADHPLAGRAEVPLDALAGERFIEREGGSGTILSLRRALTERGLSLPPHRVGMTLSTSQAILSAVREGLGVGFVSSLALADRPDGRAVAVRLAGLPVRRRLYLVRDGRRPLSTVARRFVELCLSAVDIPARPDTRPVSGGPGREPASP